MSKISQYVNLHRKSRTKFVSIGEFNSMYNANIPENKSVEAKFHADVRRKRRQMFPVRGSLYPIARELGIESASAPASSTKRSKFSMRPRRSRIAVSQAHGDDCDCHECDKEEPMAPAAVAPVRRLGMKLNNISISRPNIVPPRPEIPKVMNAVDSRRKHTVAQGGHSAASRSKGKQRSGNRHPKGKGHMNKNRVVPESSVGVNMEVRATEDHGTFTALDAKQFYQKHMPEFLETHDIGEVVQNWNKAPVDVLLASIRSKYGIAPKDQWTVSEVQSYYEHYDPEFLKNNDINSVMTDWSAVEPSVLRNLLTKKYGSCPGEPMKVVHWNTEIVSQYYSKIYPAKLQQESPEEIVADWNRHPVETIMEACKSRYGVAPVPLNYEPAAVEESHVEKYKRALEDSGEHFDATKILHFVPCNERIREFSSHASKLKSSTARFLIDGLKGPYKMFNGEYRTFKSINAKDVKTVMRAIKNNKSGNFFIRVEH